MNTVQNASFDEFWEAYPRKVAKGAARQKYMKALKMTTHGEIMAGLERYKAHLEKLATAKQYVCHASTWLGQERWTDEYEEPKACTDLSGAQVLKWQSWIAKGMPIPKDMVPILRANGVLI